MCLNHRVRDDNARDPRHSERPVLALPGQAVGVRGQDAQGDRGLQGHWPPARRGGAGKELERTYTQGTAR